MGSKSQHAYDWLRERILSHEYRPGYRIVLQTAADALQMSVVPVREAVRRLEAEGMVSFETNVGARVTLVDEDEYAETMQALGLVEGLATALAAPRLGPGGVQYAEALNRQMEHLLGDFDPHEFSRLNQEFHSSLYALCPNSHVLELVQREWARLASIRDTIFAFVPDRAAHSVAEHGELLELIRSGAEPLEIELAARNHRWRTMAAFLAARAN